MLEEVWIRRTYPESCSQRTRYSVSRGSPLAIATIDDQSGHDEGRIWDLISQQCSAMGKEVILPLGDVLGLMSPPIEAWTAP